MPFNVGATTIVTDDFKLENIADITGNYGNLQANVTSLGSGVLEIIDFATPVMTKTMVEATSFTFAGQALGKTAMLILDTSTSDHTPTFASQIKWASNSVPTWSDYRIWVITFVGFSSANVLAAATGYDI